jgi:hypothetical protein
MARFLLGSNSPSGQVNWLDLLKSLLVAFLGSGACAALLSALQVFGASQQATNPVLAAGVAFSVLLIRDMINKYVAGPNSVNPSAPTGSNAPR